MTEREHFDLASVLEPGDAVIVVPPFAQHTLSAVGPHLLQALAREAGFEVRVLYANLAYASMLGAERYEAYVTNSSYIAGFLGDRLFARAAWGLPPLGHNASARYQPETLVGPAKARAMAGLPLGHPPLTEFPLEELLEAERAAMRWVELLADELAALRFPVVGCSTLFEQTNASFALLRALVARQPGVIKLLGGSNCFGEMAEGICSADPDGQLVDHVFSGESEAAFVELLRAVARGEPPTERVIRCLPNHRLDALPPPDYREYQRQLDHFLPGLPRQRGQRDVGYEASRGCYRGQGGHCNFCGLNGTERRFRSKEPQRVVREIRDLARANPGQLVFLTDTIVAWPVVRALAEARLEVDLFACIPSRLPMHRALTLKHAGVTDAMPGIEALDDELLVAMNKGTTAADSVLCLRNLGACGLTTHWNLLWGFPGASALAWERSVQRMRLMFHLQPPASAYHVTLDRSSPYHERPERFGVHDLRPFPPYRDVFPDHADVDLLACHHLGDYPCGAYEQAHVLAEALRAMDAWHAAWASDPKPVLAVLPFGDRYFLVDSRGLDGVPTTRALPSDALAELLLPGPLGGAVRDEAVALGQGLAIDERYVPLATADPELVASLEARARP